MKKVKNILYFETKEAYVQFDFYIFWKFINDNVAFFADILIFGQKFDRVTAFLLTLIVLLF